MFKRVITLTLLSAVGLAGLGCQHGYLAPSPYEYNYYDDGVYYEGRPEFRDREHRDYDRREHHESERHEGRNHH
jgi:hypothetical protein